MAPQKNQGGLYPGETIILRIRWDEADVLDAEYRKVNTPEQIELSFQQVRATSCVWHF
jgi:hypothetical protein